MPINTRRTFLKILSALGIGAAIPRMLSAADIAKDAAKQAPHDWIPTIEDGTPFMRMNDGYAFTERQLLHPDDIELGKHMLGHGWYFARIATPNLLIADPEKRMSAFTLREKYVLMVNLSELRLRTRLVPVTDLFVIGEPLGIIQKEPFARVPVFATEVIVSHVYSNNFSDEDEIELFAMLGSPYCNAVMRGEINDPVMRAKIIEQVRNGDIPKSFLPWNSK